MTAFIEAIISIVTEAIIATVGVVMLAEAKPDEQALGRFTDSKYQCTYIIAGAEDGLHIVVNGGEHCYRRIKIDGQTIDLGRRI